ncbi:protein kinase [Martiniozyma asiatica (nom. inval.)]|nr:protein kinase [Martiniozyma asiatica]
MTKTGKLSHLASNIGSLHPYPGAQNLINPQHFYQNSILLDWSKKHAHPVTLRHLANFGKKLTEEKLVSSANFVRTELPIRLSLKIKELQSLPYGITSNYHLNQVYQSYYYCFNAFRRVQPIKTLEDNEDFCRFLSSMLDDHLIVLPHLMMGALEVSILQSLSQQDLDDFMSSMVRSRISRRVIMDQHLSMSEAFMKNLAAGKLEGDKPHDYVGDAFQNISAKTHLELSHKSISTFLKSLYPDIEMPDLIIEGNDIKFQFMTNHLNYICTEILRNAMRSTIEHFIRIQKLTDGSIRGVKPSPIIVDVTHTKSEITFKFSDKGGGVPLEKVDKIWSFGKTPELATEYLDNFHRLPGLDLPSRLPIIDHQYFANFKHKRITHNLEPNKQLSNQPPPLTGVLSNLGQLEISGSMKSQRSMLKSLSSRPFEYTLGISMPMCKVYADYWNGDLSMASVDGYGTDVTWTIGRLGSSRVQGGLDRA